MAAAAGIAAVDLDSCEDMHHAGLWMPEATRPEKHWYDDAMAWAQAQGLIRDGRPEERVTRAELATVLFRICGPEGEKRGGAQLPE